MNNDDEEWQDISLPKWAQQYATTIRLALSYLAIIMVLSIGFSITLYNVSYRELGKQVPPDMIGATMTPPVFNNYKEFFRARVSESRGELVDNLVLLNIGALLLGSVVSYYLARRTLEPIEAAMEAQSRFASDASHELRTPLTAIQAENEVALRSKDLSLEKAKKLLASNLEEVVRLKELSEGLLGLAQKQQVVEIEDVSVSDTVSEAINHVLKAAQKKDITIEDAVPSLQARGEMRRLTQALAVLLDNAIKYSDTKTVVHVEAELKDKQVHISVRDEGIGIPAESLPHIFDRFYRVDSARSKQNGSGYGLGLSIAKNSIEQLGGQIMVRSVLGKGTTFTILLPSSE